MTLLHTEITPLTKEFLYIDYRKQAFFSSPFHSNPSFHAHPELELVYIEEGFGKRIIGNKVDSFESGDMVFIGPYVPHIWLSDPVFYEEKSELESKVIVTYLNPVIFEQIFNAVKEFHGIKTMFQQALKGISIFGETRSVIAEILKGLPSKTGFEKIESILRIMHLISISNDTSFIVNTDSIYQENPHSDRLIEVIKYIDEHFNECINLKQVSQIACMTEQAFSRFFKLRTKKTFSQYLEERKMSHALDLLLQSDKSIAEIAECCGYSRSSHFCKVFKGNIGQSPYQYKNAIRKGSHVLAGQA